jgi:phage-related protein
MPSIINGIENLISSIFGAITAILQSILAVFQSIINAFIGIITTAFSALGTAVSGLAQTFEGLIKFVLSKSTTYTTTNCSLGNIVVIGVVVGAIFLYGVYNQRNGGAVKAKKTA